MGDKRNIRVAAAKLAFLQYLGERFQCLADSPQLFGGYLAGIGAERSQQFKQVGAMLQLKLSPDLDAAQAEKELCVPAVVALSSSQKRHLFSLVDILATGSQQQ